MSKLLSIVQLLFSVYYEIDYAKTALPKIPVHPATNFRVWVIPIHRPLITGIHAGAAFDAILDLKMHFLVFVHGVAIGRADPSGAFVRAAAVADIGIYDNMRLNFASALIAITHQA